MLRYFRHPPALAAAVVFLLAGVAGAQSPSTRDADDDQIDRPAVRDLEIRGVRSVDEDELIEGLATEESSCNSLILRVACIFTKSPLVYTHRYLDRDEFKRDVLRIQVFYWRRGFRSAQVDTSVVRAGDDAVNVRFTVREGPPTRVASIRVEGADSILRRRQREQLVALRPGSALDLLALDSTIVLLRDALADRGYADARLAQRVAVDDSARRADVVIAVAPGPRATVGEITIAGNQRIEDRTIRNSLTFATGDVFRASELAESQSSLYEAGLFRRATIEPLGRRSLFAVGTDGGQPFAPNEGVPTDSATREVAAADSAAQVDSVARLDSAGAFPEMEDVDSVKNVVVVVQEMQPREARLSAGFSTVDFFQTEARFTHYNWFGDARRLDLTGTIGNIGGQQLNGTPPFRNVILVPNDPDTDRYLAPTWQASADVRQRWFGSPRNTIGAGIFAHRRSSPSIFIDRGYGANATFTRSLAQGVPASATYRFEVTTVEAGSVFYCVSFGVCDLGTINALQTPQRLSPFLLTTTLDRTNQPIGPTSGFRARGELEHASAFTLSDFRYNRALGELAYYRPVRRAVLAARLRVGGVRALASTGAATGVELVDSVGGVIIHPRKRFYAGGSQSVRGYGENQLGPRVLTIPAAELRRGRVIGGDTVTACPPGTQITDCNTNSQIITDAGDTVSVYQDDQFQPRPLGGNSLIEASVEYRFPVWGPLTGAVFVDGAVVGAADFNAIATGNLAALASGTGAITPGFGVRYQSPVGPVRVDVGINPQLAERLPVVTERVDADGSRTLVRLNTNRRYNPAEGEGIRGFLRRFTIHLSIGEAF